VLEKCRSKFILNAQNKQKKERKTNKKNQTLLFALLQKPARSFTDLQATVAIEINVISVFDYVS
jgi:hypothetical protein